MTAADRIRLTTNRDVYLAHVVHFKFAQLPDNCGMLKQSCLQTEYLQIKIDLCNRDLHGLPV